MQIQIAGDKRAGRPSRRVPTLSGLKLTAVLDIVNDVRCPSTVKYVLKSLEILYDMAQMRIDLLTSIVAPYSNRWDDSTNRRAGSSRGENMPEKKLFVLANSIKKQQRCIAGIEIVTGKDGEEYWGNWIRPVTHHDEGAISMSECRLQDGAIPAPLDVVQVPLTSPENSATQPENWFIKQGANWRKITSWSRKEAQRLTETPPDLWLEPGVKQDRVRPQYLLSQKSRQSLYLIQPVNFRFLVEITNWEGIEKKRIRGVFNYVTVHRSVSADK